MQTHLTQSRSLVATPFLLAWLYTQIRLTPTRAGSGLSLQHQGRCPGWFCDDWLASVSGNTLNPYIKKHTVYRHGVSSSPTSNSPPLCRTSQEAVKDVKLSCKSIQS